jgi:cytochrome P450
VTHRTPDHRQSPVECPTRLEDVDLFSPGAQEHWYEAYPILHRDCPVVTLAIRQLEALDVPLEEAPRTNAMLISMATLRPDNELYRAHRQELTDPWVGPGASRHTPMITRYVDQLIDQWIDHGEVEFVAEFARPLPQMVMATVLGFPLEDVPQLAEWGNAQVMAYVHGHGHRNQLTRAQLDEQFEKLDGFKEYVFDKVREKRRHPADDMISWLCQVEYRALGRRLTDMEVNGIVYAMVIGGLETTQYALAEQAQLLCEHPAKFQELKENRDLIRPFVEESLRLRSPTQGLSTRTNGNVPTTCVWTAKPALGTWRSRPAPVCARGPASRGSSRALPGTGCWTASTVSSTVRTTPSSTNPASCWAR